jgi:hypothetical protein
MFCQMCSSSIGVSTRGNVLVELCRTVASLSVVCAETVDVWRVGHVGGRDGGMEILYCCEDGDG